MLLLAHPDNKIDILKIDIEGAEKEVFSDNIDGWLKKTKLVIIELHEESKPGCINAVETAMRKYNFQLFLEKGENLIYLNSIYIDSDCTNKVHL